VFLPNGVYDISLFKKKNDFVTASVPREPLVLHDIAVPMPIGAFANYGHFILDCLPTAVFMQRQESFRHLRIIMPPMNKWHNDLLALFDVRTVTIGGTFKGKNVYYTSLMDHGLHNLGYLHEYMRITYLSTVVPKINAIAPDRASPRRVYLARDGFSNRTNASEHALRVALAEQGFTPINPEVLSCAEQMGIAFNADVIVSASGAALANVFFASEKAKVFEIFPEGMDSQWVKQICSLIGCDYAAYFVRNTERRDLQNLSEGITYDIDVEKFMSFLAAHI
jgi:capsular polysaccharide biosynthesis protein